jgi:uncharacterized protein (DUF1499 family)
MNQPHTNPSPDTRTSHLRHFGAASLVFAILAAATVLSMMFGARFGLWQPIQGFGLYRTYFNPIAYVTAATALAALLFHLARRESKGMALSAVAMVIGAGLLGPIARAALDPPVRAAPIHDISTDTQNPPVFLVLDDTRPGAQNSLQYAGDEIATLQAQAYPDIAPILTDRSAPEAYRHALAIADEMGWKLVAQQDDDLRFEATAHTPVFYFADDVVLVVTPQPDGSRIDIRSVSRVGRSDQGVNAARIRSFAEAFNR